MFAQVEVLQQRLQAPGFVFLTTVELDVEAGRFPEVFAAYISHTRWTHASRFVVSPLVKADAGEYGIEGRLTFDSTEIPVGDILSLNSGFRWGANLLVGGIQVPEESVGAAARDLTSFAVWSPLGNESVKQQLIALV